MHILIEGKVMEARYTETPMNVSSSSNSSNPNNPPTVIGTNYNWNFALNPTYVSVPVSYKVVVDSKEIMLYSTEKGYFAQVKGLYLILTETIYQDLLRSLNRINMDEAVLYNEMMLKKEGKTSVKELKDGWDRKKCQALLGLSLNDE